MYGYVYVYVYEGLPIGQIIVRIGVGVGVGIGIDPRPVWHLALMDRSNITAESGQKHYPFSHVRFPSRVHPYGSGHVPP